jgi:hypothetical protein
MEEAKVFLVTFIVCAIGICFIICALWGSRSKQIKVPVPSHDRIFVNPNSPIINVYNGIKFDIITFDPKIIGSVFDYEYTFIKDYGDYVIVEVSPIY